MIELLVLFLAWSIFGLLNFIHVIECERNGELSLRFFFASGPAVWMFFFIMVGGRSFRDWMHSF